MRASAGHLVPQILAAVGKYGLAYWGWVRFGLGWASRHSDIPTIVICALLLVVLYRLAKRSARFVAQVSVVLAVLAVLAKLGILRF